MNNQEENYKDIAESIRQISSEMFYDMLESLDLSDNEKLPNSIVSEYLNDNFENFIITNYEYFLNKNDQKELPLNKLKSKIKSKIKRLMLKNLRDFNEKLMKINNQKV